MTSQATLRRYTARAMYVVAFIMPATNLPQILQLFSSHITTGLSLQTWVMYLVVGLVPFLYAIAYNMKPLIISNVLWIVVELIMIYGIIRFGTISNDNDLSSLITINTIGKTINGLGLILISSALVLLAENIIETNHSKR